MAAQVSLEVCGARVYLVGDTYSIKAKLKEAGCHWDGDRRQWWIGKAKADSLQAILDGAGEASEDDRKAELGSMPVKAKVNYKGRSYFVVAESRDGMKVRLTVLDCSIDFWALKSACELVKQYAPRVNYRTNRESWMTVNGMRSFVEQAKREREQLDRGEIPAGYCVDMEDGQVKRRSECDMPSEC